MLKKLILLSALLFVCIVMMCVALFADAEVFGMLSGYFSIICVVLSLIGVLIMVKKNKF